MTLVFVVFVVGAMLSPVAIKATLVKESEGEVDVTCTAMELEPCLSAFTSGEKPTGECCTKLDEQKPCLCDYIKNPAYKKYVDSPNARKVLAACNIPLPSC